MSESYSIEEPKNSKSSREFYLQQAFLKRLDAHQSISGSAEDYVRSLLHLGDNKINGHGIDAIDRSFTPPMHYEIKTGLENIIIPDTELHYQNGSVRSYLIAVKRTDNILTYKKTKKFNRNKKFIRSFNNQERLLFDFGDIFILPFEVIKDHYIVQRTKNLTDKNIKSIGKKYKNLKNLQTVMGSKVKKEVNKTIKMRENDESISHDNRTNVILTFAQAAQIIIKYGDHYRLLTRTKAFNRNYDFVVIDGPILNSNPNNKSKIFIMDYDRKIMDDLIKRLAENNKVQEINEIKRGRLQLHKEIEDKKKDWSEFDNPNLEKRLNALVRWQNYKENLFS